MRRTRLQAAAAMLACLALAAFAVSACGDGDDDAPDGGETPGATASGPDYLATANARLLACTVERAACKQGADVEVALSRGDSVFIVRAATPVAFVCPEPGEGVEPLAEVCADKEPGATVEGYRIGRLQSEGGVVDDMGLSAFVSDWLGSLQAPPAFTSLGCPVEGDAPACGDAYVLVFSGTTTAGNEEVMALVIERDELYDLGVTQVLTGLGATNPEMIGGGDTADFPTRPGVFTRYTAINAG